MLAVTSVPESPPTEIWGGKNEWVGISWVTGTEYSKLGALAALSVYFIIHGVVLVTSTGHSSSPQPRVPISRFVIMVSAGVWNSR